MVLDGVKTADRPAAVGYFVMDTVRYSKQKYNRIVEMTLKAGGAEPSVIHEHQRIGGYIYVPIVGQDWFGDLYRLTLAVERNEPRILDS